MRKLLVLIFGAFLLVGCSVEAKQVQDSEDGRRCWLVYDKVGGVNVLACEETINGKNK